jgi:hypothetical protein
MQIALHRYIAEGRTWGVLEWACAINGLEPAHVFESRLVTNCVAVLVNQFGKCETILASLRLLQVKGVHSHQEGRIELSVH